MSRLNSVDYINGCVQRHGPSVRRDAEQETDALEAMAAWAAIYVANISAIHSALDMAREHTNRNGVTIRLDYDPKSALQGAVDGLDLGQEASALVYAMALPMLDDRMGAKQCAECG